MSPLPDQRRSPLLACLALALMAVGRGGGGGGGDGLPDGGEPDGDAGVPSDPSAEGQFVVAEVVLGEDGTPYGSVFGTIISPRLGFHTVAMEQGACRLSTYEPGDCGPDYCDGICDTEGVCRPYPLSLSAGVVTFSGLAQDITIAGNEYGYYPDFQPAGQLFDPGDPVGLAAAGAAVPAFEVAASGVGPIRIPLERFADGDPDFTLRLEDGADLALSWESLRRAGNLSSASVLLILEATIERARPPRGSRGLMLAMGPGFCSELVLLQW